MKKVISLSVMTAMVLFSGCALEDKDPNINSSEASQSETSFSSPEEITSSTTTTTTSVSSSQTTASSTYLDIDDVIPAAIQTPRVDGDRLSYTIINVYSEDEYYTVDISGIKITDETDIDIDTTYIDGELYGDFRLDLMRSGEIIDTLKINIPRDDRFLILESVKDGLSYGCELISNKRGFYNRTYPDLIQLDFHIINEVETPQYARFFAIFDGKLSEVPVYQDGVEKAPYGTHLEMDKPGVMTQHIVASNVNGNYEILKFEYRFDVDNRCLVRKKVRY
ncbi:MAG: hypothetical protein IJZ95_02695 [Oscillospiraceae bacterium]|nr:hypothetical protein [Oscillospiraceae bacterium]